jgi:serine phosphatase RsbU (regulator of sigma subunit)
MQQHPGLSDHAVTWAVHPAHGCSGDAVAAQRTPSGRLLAMLADATGHGPAAAGNLLPALEAFYAAAGRDRPAGAVAREINRCLQAAGETGRFIAAVVVELDPMARRATVWNGGLPAGLWVRGASEVATDALGPRHPPLGVLADAQFDATCTTLSVAGGGRLVFCSDGLLEAADAAGSAFGIDRLRSCILGGSAARGVERVEMALRTHLGQASAADDVSLLLISLDQQAAGL